MKKRNLTLDFTVGIFMLLGILCLGYLSVRLARKDFFEGDGYPVKAVFSNIGGLSVGANVKIAGVEIGRVTGISLDDFEARVEMLVGRGIDLSSDTIASIKTNGLFGEKYVELVPGAEEASISAGGMIRVTEPAMDFESLISGD